MFWSGARAVSETIDEQLQQAKDRVARWRQLKRQLPPAQKHVGSEDFQLRRLELCLEQATRRLHSLESLTLESLMDGLFGRRERKLADHREELARVQTVHEECADVVRVAQEQVELLESQIDELAGAEGIYQAICQKKERHALDRNDHRALELEDVLAEFEVARDTRRGLAKACQIGKHLLGRLDTMANALGRARSKLGGTGPVGRSGARAVNAISRQGSEGATGRVRDGLEEFARAIDGLEPGGDDHVDCDLRRLSTVMTEFRGELSGHWVGKIYCNMGVTLPIIEQVQAALGYLEHKLEHSEAQVERIERRRRELIETA